MSGVRGDIVNSFSQLNADQRAKSVELREELASELHLENDRRQHGCGSAKTARRFDAAYASISGMIGETLKLALIRDAVREKVLGLFFRLGPIQFLIDIPVISEIMVCGHDRILWKRATRCLKPV